VSFQLFSRNKSGAHQWRGVIEEYRDRLPVSSKTPVVTLREGGTPLVEATNLSKILNNDIWLKFEGANPTGSFKDRGMTMAISKAVKAGMVPAVLIPKGKIALGKLAQAVAHGSKILQVNGNFDDCLTLARESSENFPVALVNSVNPFRIEGQKTASFEVIDALGFAPDIHALPVGNAGNITAYWKGYVEYEKDGMAKSKPAMWGFQAEGAAPIVRGEPVKNPETIATAIRIGNPASWQQALAARDESGGVIDMVSDEEILSAYRLVAAKEGIFVEPSSAAGIAGLIKYKYAKKLPKGKRIVITVTGNGLKDVQWVLDGAPSPTVIPVDVKRAAEVIGLA